MTPVSPEKLVIFDYSGTLSLEAPRFARPENLVAALAESGLAALGVATAEAFWGGIVGPTWAAASTTATGYKRAIAERIGAIGQAPGAAGVEGQEAASRFVDRYLAHSRIDPLWRPVLETLTGHAAAALVIATDHYAEATGALIDHLRLWKIPAEKAAETIRERSAPSRCIIANSADIGFWKADRRFWETVKPLLPIAAVRSVLIVDDFGFNEEQGDRWAERTRVEERQQRTAAALRAVFQASVAVLPFRLESGERDCREPGARRIAEAARRIDRFLKSGDSGEGAS